MQTLIRMSALSSSHAPEFPSLLDPPTLRWNVRGFAVAAALLTAWLLWQKLSGQITSLKGCGDAGGCHQVLGGRWSSWMGLPVSGLALGLYVGVLLLTLRPVQRRLGLQADRLLCAAALITILAAGWFIGLMRFAEETFCPYCVVAHTLGLGFALPVLIAAWRVRDGQGPGFVLSAFSVAAPAFIILVLGQWFGPLPDTHQITVETIDASAPPPPLAVAQPASPPSQIAFPELAIQPPPRIAVPDPGDPAPKANPPVAEGKFVSFFNGQFHYSLDELPFLGSKTAEHVMVEYFDYTCRSCRDMAGDLRAMQKTFENKFAIIPLPCPLNPKCNPNLPPNIEEHPNACEVAQLALAVWRKAPAKFPQFHEALLSLPLPVDLAKASAAAAELVGGSEALNQALTDPWIKQRMTETITQYRLFSSQNIRMPKLLLKDQTMMHGPARDEATFLNVLRQIFGLK